jgi:hypothetical protein
MKVKIIKTGNERYIIYNKKKYKIISDDNDQSILNKLEKIIKLIMNEKNKKKRKRRKGTKKNKIGTLEPSRVSGLSISNGENKEPKSENKDLTFLKYMMMNQPRLLLPSSPSQPSSIVPTAPRPSSPTRTPIQTVSRPSSPSNQSSQLIMLYQKEIKEQEQEIKDQEQELKDLSDQIKKYKALGKSPTSGILLIEEEEEKLKELEEKLIHANKDFKFYQEQLDHMGDKTKEIGELEEKINKYFQQSEDLLQEIDEKQDEITKMTKEVETTEKNLKKINKELIRVENERNDLLDEINDATNTLDKLRKDNEDLKKDYEDIKQGKDVSDELVIKYDAERKRLELEIQDVENNLQDKQKELKELKKEISNYKDRLIKNSELIKENEKKIKDNETLIQQNEQDLKGLKTKYDTSKNEIDEKNKELLETQKKLDEAKEKEKEIDQIFKEKETMYNQMNITTQIVNSLQKEHKRNVKKFATKYGINIEKIVDIPEDKKIETVKEWISEKTEDELRTIADNFNIPRTVKKKGTLLKYIDNALTNEETDIDNFMNENGIVVDVGDTKYYKSKDELIDDILGDDIAVREYAMDKKIEITRFSPKEGVKKMNFDEFKATIVQGGIPPPPPPFGGLPPPPPPFGGLPPPPPPPPPNGNTNNAPKGKIPKFEAIKKYDTSILPKDANTVTQEEAPKKIEEIKKFSKSIHQIYNKKKDNENVDENKLLDDIDTLDKIKKFREIYDIIEGDKSAEQKKNAREKFEKIFGKKLRNEKNEDTDKVKELINLEKMFTKERMMEIEEARVALKYANKSLNEMKMREEGKEIKVTKLKEKEPEIDMVDELKKVQDKKSKNKDTKTMEEKVKEMEDEREKKKEEIENNKPNTFLDQIKKGETIKPKKTAEEIDAEVEEKRKNKKYDHDLGDALSNAITKNRSKIKDDDDDDKNNDDKNNEEWKDDGDPGPSNLTGNGKKRNKNDGLFNNEIDNMMKTVKYFKGTYAIDQLNSIKINKNDPYFSFIMNTEPIKIASGHWIAWFITRTSIEYYDSFGEDPTSESLTNVFKLARQYIPKNKFQVKINRIKYQRNNTNNCGWFAMKFIKDRSTGKTFKEATGFKLIEKSLKGEKAINKFKSRVEDFGFVKV